MARTEVSSIPFTLSTHASTPEAVWSGEWRDGIARIAHPGELATWPELKARPGHWELSFLNFDA